MALDSTKVDVAVTGAVAFAPTDTAAPTDADTALPADWRDVGYISTDGVVETRDLTTNNIVAWQNADIVRVVVTEASLAVTFTMIESNPNSLELFYGAPVDTVNGKINILPSRTGGRRSVVVDYVDGGKFVRLYLPSAELTSVGEVTLANGDAVGYEVTLTAYPVTVASEVVSGQKFLSDLVVVP
jgi:hypothetical protein